MLKHYQFYNFDEKKQVHESVQQTSANKMVLDSVGVIFDEQNRRISVLRKDKNGTMSYGEIFNIKDEIIASGKSAINLGGIKKGDDLSGMSVTDIIKKIFIKDEIETKKIFFGYFSEDESLDFTKLTSAELELGKGFLWSNISITNKIIVFATPKEHGKISKIIDKNGLDYISSFDEQEVVFNDTAYYAYTLNGAVSIESAVLVFK